VNTAPNGGFGALQFLAAASIWRGGAFGRWFGIFVAGMALIGELYPIDVAMLPIGSVFTMDYRQAAKACALLRAKAVIPMHFGTFPILEPNADRFVAELAKVSPGTRPIVLAPGEETTV